MERKLFGKVYWLLSSFGKSRPRRCQYSEVQVLLVLFWAVLHDRPVHWACQPENGLAQQLGWSCLPSPATMSRRLRTLCCLWLLRQLEQVLQPPPQAAVLLIDARPLPVGWHSKDRDARVGRGAGRKDKGYKFYSLWDERGHLLAWAVWPMQVDERAVAGDLIRHVQGPGWILGDRIYDAGHLYEKAARQGRQWLVYRNPDQGLGHRPQSEHRLAGIALQATAQGQQLLGRRVLVEAFQGQQCSCPVSLYHPPVWVRRWRRVRLWVWAKVILQALWRRHRQGLAA